MKEVRNSLSKIKRRWDNWIGDCLSRNCLLKYFIVGKVEQKRRKGCRRAERRRRGIRRKQLLHGFKERDRYLSTKDAAIDRTFCRTPLDGLWTCHLTDYTANRKEKKLNLEVRKWSTNKTDKLNC